MSLINTFWLIVPHIFREVTPFWAVHINFHLLIIANHSFGAIIQEYKSMEERTFQNSLTLVIVGYFLDKFVYILVFGNESC